MEPTVRIEQLMLYFLKQFSHQILGCQGYSATTGVHRRLPIYYPLLKNSLKLTTEGNHGGKPGFLPQCGGCRRHNPRSNRSRLFPGKSVGWMQGIEPVFQVEWFKVVPCGSFH